MSYAEDWGESVRQHGEIAALLPYNPIPRYNRSTALAHLGREEESLEELHVRRVPVLPDLISLAIGFGKHRITRHRVWYASAPLPL